MKRTLTLALVLTACSQTTLQPTRAPSSTSAPVVEKTALPESQPQNTSAASPKEAFALPKQSLFVSKPNFTGGFVSIERCEIVGQGIALSRKVEFKEEGPRSLTQNVIIESPKGNETVSCQETSAPDEPAIIYNCPGFTWSISGPEGSTDYEVKGKIAEKKIDVKGTAAFEKGQLYCSFPHPLTSEKAPELASSGLVLTCPVLDSSFEVSFAATSGEAAVSLVRHGDGDVGHYYPVPCQKEGDEFSCSGTFWPLWDYREEPPKEESGEPFLIKISAGNGAYRIVGTLHEEPIAEQRCMRLPL